MASIAAKMVLKCSRATSDESVAIFFCADSMEKSESDAQHIGGKAHLSSAPVMNPPVSTVQHVHDEGRESAPRSKSDTGNITHKHTYNTNTESQNHTQSTLVDTNTEEQVKDPAGMQGEHLEVAGHCLTRELLTQMAPRVTEAVLDMEDSFMDENILNPSMKRKSIETKAMCEKVKKMSTDDQRCPASQPEEDTCSLRDKRDTARSKDTHFTTKHAGHTQLTGHTGDFF